MRLDYPFYKFPFRFDVERLRREIEAFPEDAWHWHHENFQGNSALHLVTTNGEINEDFATPMMPTGHLAKMPYVMQVLAQFRTLLGRSRLLRLEPQKGVPLHVDNHYYWRTHTRVHIPIVTDPGIRFQAGDQSVHMAAGEAWTFSNWLPHTVINETQTRRIHLTFDTYGSSVFWAMARPPGAEWPEQFIPYREGFIPELNCETHVGPSVMPPAELELEVVRLASDLTAHPHNDQQAVAGLKDMLLGFLAEWRINWYEHGPDGPGTARFQALRASAMGQAERFAPARLFLASNNSSVAPILLALFEALMKAPLPNSAEEIVELGPRFDRPIFIVSAPRSGSTLLFEMLAASDDLWTIGGEGHEHIESIQLLRPQNFGMDSNRLMAESATDTVKNRLKANYIGDLRNADAVKWSDLNPNPGVVRFLEKTPKNALRIPFLKRVFPDAKFIFLHRDARANISAIIEAWRSGGFVTYPDLPGWTGMPWSLLLIPAWRALIGADLAEIAMRQWRDTNQTIIEDLERLPHSDWCAVRYEDLVVHPAETLRRLCDFAGIEYGNRLRAVTEGPLKPSRYTLTAPDSAKWKRNESLMEPYLAATESVSRKLARLLTKETAVAAAK